MSTEHAHSKSAIYPLLLLLTLAGVVAGILLLVRTGTDATASARFSRQESTAGSEPANGLAGAEVRLEAAAGEGAERELLPAPPPAAVSSSAQVVVLVTLADGSPASGLAVLLALDEGVEGAPLEQTTDGAGQAAFEVPAGRVLRSVKVPATPATTPAGKWLDTQSRAGAVVEVALRVSSGWPLAGRVIGPGGAPVPEALVFGWCSERSDGEPERVVRADGRGGFRLEHMGPRFCVTAQAPGLACSRGLRGEVSDAVIAAGLTVELAPERRMYGVVLDPQRNPIAGAKVWVDHSSSTSETDATGVPGILPFSAGHGSALTDAGGNFELRGLSRDRHLLQVEHAPYLVDREWRTTGPERHEIVLDAGLSLRGRVLDAAGRPAAGARVRFWPFYGNLQTVEDECVCDEAGEFLLRGMCLRHTFVKGKPRARSSRPPADALD